jgi:hypothetical protein
MIFIRNEPAPGDRTKRGRWHSRGCRVVGAWGRVGASGAAMVRGGPRGAWEHTVGACGGARWRGVGRARHLGVRGWLVGASNSYWKPWLPLVSLNHSITPINIYIYIYIRERERAIGSLDQPSQPTSHVPTSHLHLPPT